MAKILVITHGNMASEIVDIAIKITEQPSKVLSLCLEQNFDPSEYTQKITDYIASLESDQNLIILTDLFGGTPSNLAIPFIRKDRIEVITGLNLPMLLYLMSQPEDKDFTELCLGAKKAGEEAIIIAGDFLS